MASLRTLAASKVSHARLGLLSTKDGVVETPAFVAVATNAALKAVDLRDVPGIDMIFANTYHLMLHPGVDVVAKAGGVKPFMNAGDGRIIMTDSGGFQVFSLKYGTVHGELTQTQTQTQTQTHTPSLKMNSVSIDVDPRALAPHSSPASCSPRTSRPASGWGSLRSPPHLPSDSLTRATRFARSLGEDKEACELFGRARRRGGRVVPVVSRRDAAHADARG